MLSQSFAKLFGYLKNHGDETPPIQKRMGGYFHDNDVLV
jgi:hypothetical protein